MRDVKKFRRSFRFAYEGLKYALTTQQNMQFHFSAAFLVFIAAIVLEISRVETLLLLLAVTLVIVTELINTAVEKTVDLAMPDRHPLAKIAKDVAAAAVLVSAAFAAVTGMVVFYEPIDLLLRHAASGDRAVTPGMIWSLVALVALTVVVLQSRFARGRAVLRPSLMTAISFSVSTWVTLLTSNTLVALLGYSLSLQMMLFLAAGRRSPLASLLTGALLGSGITILAYALIESM